MMAEVDKQHYNLRSGTNIVQLPVQIQMETDSDFISKISQNDQNSDSNDSALSELDCSAIIDDSDSEQIPGKECNQSTSSTPSTSSAGSTLSNVATQQAINVQILAQLSSAID